MPAMRAKTAKTPVKKTVNKTAKNKTAKKTTAKKPSAKSPARAAVVTVVAINPSSDGTRWTLGLSDKTRVRVSAAAAQAVRARVGMTWTAAASARIATADAEQQAFNRALAVVMKRPAIGRAALADALGGDALAARTVRALAKNGWI